VSIVGGWESAVSIVEIEVFECHSFAEIHHGEEGYAEIAYSLRCFF
jgi:hypothetical protein